MSKRMLIITVALCLVAFVAGFGFAAYKSVSSEPEFASDGYVLSQKDLGVDRIAFGANERFKVTNGGVASFKSGDEQVNVSSQSFAMLDNGSVMAMSDGVLLDFNDLSDNFINHYFISARLPIFHNGNTYTASTTSGDITFGDHMWKLSDQKYLIESPKLNIVFSEDDKRPVDNYVQVIITDDGIVQLLTEENLWMTISDTCYIETESGVKIYPLSKLITTDEYKLSTAKLSVTPEDSIVLTEDETRRQIVPQLNIETIDGKDGTDGNEGDVGQTGTEGSSGEKGEAGENGTSGGNGTDGTEGEGGKNGQAGKSGEGGQSGSDGSSGSDGKNGTSGPRGENAKIASSTNTALPEMTFTEFDISATELRGRITIEDENEYLKTVNKDEHPATVIITEVETGKVIDCYQINKGQAVSSQHGTEFTDINAGTPEVYFATKPSALKPDTNYHISVVAYYKVNELTFSREFLSRDFYTDSAGVYLTYQSADSHSVKLNVSKMDGGIDKATVFLLTPNDNLTFKAVGADDKDKWNYKFVLDYGKKTYQLWRGKENYEKISPEPDPTISSLGADDSMNSVDINFKEVAKTLIEKYLDSDRTYVARVIVEAGTLTMLTEQQLEVKTLKAAPEWNDKDIPLAGYNRVTGGFEVYRPTVKCPDGGVMAYVYTAYDGNEAVATRTLTAGEGEPAVFYLSDAPRDSEDPTQDPTVLRPGVNYTFNVEMKFFDNEKEVIYDLGRSESVKATGSALPKVVLQETKKEYNLYEADMLINLSGSECELDVSRKDNHGMELRLYADGVMDYTAMVYDSEPVTNTSGTTIYKYTYSPSLATTNEHRVNLKFENLKQNTNYTLSVFGYLNVNDGQGLIKREIGSISFRTYSSLKTRATFQNTSKVGTGSNISAKLSMVPLSELTGEQAKTDPRVDYARDQLAEGQLELKLYDGSGTQMATQHMAQAILTEEQMQVLFEDGGAIEINDTTFNSPELLPDRNYTIMITRLVDGSATKSLPYTNDYKFEGTTKLTVTTSKKVPDLPKNPSEQVIATPIHNVESEVRKYGGTVDPGLPAEAIVGFHLKANYDNSNHLATDITYYAMEYRQFFAKRNTSGKVSLLNEDIPTIMKTKLSVGKEQGDVPEVVYWFGADQDGNDWEDMPDGYYGYNGNVYYYMAGTPVISDDALVSGMGRGFRYIFAYTVNVDLTGAHDPANASPYPECVEEQFETRRDTVGCGSIFGVGYPDNARGNDIYVKKAYMLNSGMCEAPKVSPTFYAYLYAVDFDGLDSKGTATGTAEVHYTYKFDPDDTVSHGQGGRARSEIKYIYNENEIVLEYGDYDEDITSVLETNELGETWYSTKFKFASTKHTETGSKMNGEKIDVTIDIDTYAVSYKNEYEALQYIEGFGKQETYLCHIPVDWNWDKYFLNLNDRGEVTGEARGISVEVDASEQNQKENFINFVVKSSNPTSLVELGKRALVMKTTFTVKDVDPTDVYAPKTFYLPLEVDTEVLRAKFLTGQLPGEWVTHDIQLSSEIYYDNGDQGWQMTEVGSEGNLIAVQTAADTEGNNALGSYLVADPDGKAVRMFNATKGGLFEVKDTTTASGPLMKRARQEILNLASKISPRSRQVMTMSCIYSDLNYLNNFQRTVNIKTRGVDFSATNNDDGRCYTIKGVSTTGNLTYAQDEFRLLVVMPTIAGVSHTTSPTEVYLDSFSVNGMYEGVYQGNKVVYVSIFDNNDDASAVKLYQGTQPNPHCLGTITIPLNEDNKYVYDRTQPETQLRFSKLTKEKTYYLVYYMNLLDPETGEYKFMPLRKEGTKDSKAISVYSATTLSDVKITSSKGLVYTNEQNVNYFDKNIEFSFNVNPYKGVKDVRFSFWDGADSVGGKLVIDKDKHHMVSNSDGSLVLDNATMLSDPNRMLSTDFSVEAVGSTNTQIINLTPNAKTSLLKPGKTYYMLVEAFESKPDEVAGSAVFRVSIPPVGVTSAYIKAEDATKDSVKFLVSISDSQYSFMGANPYEEDNYKNGVGLYMVRFTYTDYKDGKPVERLIRTRYDDYVFSEGEVKKPFILDNDATLEGFKIEPNTKYTMKIYAVLDDTHCGSVPDIKPVASVGFTGMQKTKETEFGPQPLDPTDPNYGLLTWDDFFSGLQEPATPWSRVASEKTAPKFSALLNQFWTADRWNISELDGIEDRFCKTTRVQSTADENNILFDPSSAVLTRWDSTGLRVLLPESFGIDNIYQKIEWQISGEVSLSGGTTRALDEFQTIEAADGDKLIERVPEGSDLQYRYYYCFRTSSKNSTTGQQKFEVPNGNYLVQLRLYKDESSAPDTISLRFYSGN